MLDFDKVFKPEYQYTLKNISYELKAPMTRKEPLGELSLLCDDDIVVTSNENDGLEFEFTRHVTFTPIELYEISVSYGVYLRYSSEDAKKLVNECDMKTELINGGAKYFSSIIPRASALIAAITSSYGQIPIILPPEFILETTLQ